jgi:hypothetical protein
MIVINHRQIKNETTTTATMPKKRKAVVFIVDGHATKKNLHFIVDVVLAFDGAYMLMLLLLLLLLLLSFV